MLLQHTETKTTVNRCNCSCPLDLCNPASQKIFVFTKWSYHRSVNCSTVPTASSTKHKDTTDSCFVHCVQLWNPPFCLTTHNHQQATALMFQNVQHDLQNKHVLGTWQAKWCFKLWQVSNKGRQDRPQTLYAQFLLLSWFIWIPAHKGINTFNGWSPTQSNQVWIIEILRRQTLTFTWLNPTHSMTNELSMLT